MARMGTLRMAPLGIATPIVSPDEDLLKVDDERDSGDETGMTSSAAA